MVKNNTESRMFDFIAPIYGLFYANQWTHFRSVLRDVRSEIDLSLYNNAVDIGCGTGALCSALKMEGLDVVGIDPATKMLNVARRKPENAGIDFIQADVLTGLPFDDDQFDIAIASYVAHGLSSEERLKMYTEMRRVAKRFVIIHDYNQKRALLTSLIEWLERGDYFNFIKLAEEEMQAFFGNVRVIDLGGRAAWYVSEVNK